MTPDQDPRGWRDALTPSSRASRQRWTAFYALLLIAIGVGALDRSVQEAITEDGRGVLSSALLLLVFGMLRRGTRRLTATDHPELDERDRRARDRAFRLAMPLFLLVVLATVLALPAALDGVDRAALVDGRRSPYLDLDQGWFLDWSATFALVVWLLLWAVFLPTGILAWREPDAPVDEDAPPATMSALARDAILGGAVLVAVVLTTVGLALAAFGVLLAAVAALGVVARRGGGRMTVRPQFAATIAAMVVAVGVVAAMLGWGAPTGISLDTGESVASLGTAHLPAGVTRWKSQYGSTCLVVRAATGADLDRQAAGVRRRRLGLEDERLCRF